MSRLDVSPAVRALCEAVAEHQDVELVDVRFRQGRTLTLEVVVDRDSEVDFDLVTAVSKELSDALDEDEGLIEPSYVLEVSSAGLERPLLKPADYRRFVGREIRVVCRHPIAGAIEHRGRIASASDDTFALDRADGPIEIGYEAVKKAHLWVDWELEFKKAEEHQGAGGRSPGRRKRKFVGGKR